MCGFVPKCHAIWERRSTYMSRSRPLFLWVGWSLFRDYGGSTLLILEFGGLLCVRFMYHRVYILALYNNYPNCLPWDTGCCTVRLGDALM